MLIAGGIGVTPMMSMIRTLADRGDKRPVVLLYGVRTGIRSLSVKSSKR